MKRFNQSVNRLGIAAGLLVTLCCFAGLARGATTTPSYLTLSQQPMTMVRQGVEPNIFFLLDDTVSMQSEWMGNLVPWTFMGNSSSSSSAQQQYQFTFGYPQGWGGVYGTAGNGNLYDVIPGFNSGNVYGAEFRSNYFNSNYYNPAETYTPWACPAPYPESSTQTIPLQTAAKSNVPCHWDANAQLWVMPDANPNAAFLNPYDNTSTSPARSLTVWNDDQTGNPTPKGLGLSSTTTAPAAGGNGYIGQAGETGLQWYIYNAGSYSDPGSVPYTNTPCGSDNCPNYQGGFWPAVYWNYTGGTPLPSPLTTANFQQVQICPPDLVDNSTSNQGKCSPPPRIGSVTCPTVGYTYTDGSDDYIYVQSVSSCAPTSEIKRTYQEEIQNFANWYTYYRSRVNMSRAGASIAFMGLPPTFKVDFSTVSGMAAGSPVTVNTTEPFTVTQRTAFLKGLFQQPVSSPTTSLRMALQGAGQWFVGNPSPGSAPWGSSQAEAKVNGKIILTCRANYTLLVSADYWNGGGPTVINASPHPDVDSNNGPTWTDANGSTTYGYTASRPWLDNISSTLADVAQYYWENDLQTGLANDVPVNSSDPAFWQHMVTYSIGLGITPTLVQAYMNAHPGMSESVAQAAVYQELQNGSASWPKPGANLSTDADDLWHAAVDGHGVFFSARDPQQFEQDLASALNNIVARTASGSSVATNTQKAGQVRTNTQVYQAMYHPLNWWGQLLAESILCTSSTGQAESCTTTGATSPYVSAVANWDASCVLTGGPCPAMGINSTGQAINTITAESPGARFILTDQGCPTASCTTTTGMQSPGLFQWNATTNDLSTDEQDDLLPTNGTTSDGEAVVAYLRGVRTEEASNGGPLRTRTSVLGDIVHSSPLWVGYPDEPYPPKPCQMTSSPTHWCDVLYPGQTMPENSGSYPTFEQNNASRLNLVFAGANDGMLHAFEAGSFTNNTSAGLTFDSTYNDGKEVLAFVPRRAYENLLSYTSPTYTHHYFEDATTTSGDVFYGGAWHTWLAGGLGAGGKELFVLDINHPDCFISTTCSVDPASVVMADWTGENKVYDSTTGTWNVTNPGTLQCVNDSNCAADLGDTFGTPEIRRFHSGQWGIIWGNGYNSDNGQAGIFVGLISQSSSTPTSSSPGTMSIKVYWIPCPAVTDPTGQGRPDGIAYVNTADLNGTDIVDYAYAGDLFGNVWRFNLTSDDPDDWHVSTYNGSTGTPLYTAVNAQGIPQAITTQVQIVSIPSDLPAGDPQYRIMVLFGTGKLLEPKDETPNLTATGVQSLYGVWDWGMSRWDNGTAASSGTDTSSTTTDATEPEATLTGTSGLHLYAAATTSTVTTVPSTGSPLTRNNLLQQSITSEQYSTNSSGVQVGLRQTSQYPVQWADSSYGGTKGTQYGWYLDLVSPVNQYHGEMVIYNPDIQSGALVVNTTILGQQPLTCGPNDNGGWTMALDPSNGAMLTFNAFAIQNIADYTGSFDSGILQGTYSGITVGAVGSPAYVSFNGVTYMVVSTSSGKTKLVKTGFGTGHYNQRINWRELR